MSTSHSEATTLPESASPIAETQITKRPHPVGSKSRRRKGTSKPSSENRKARKPLKKVKRAMQPGGLRKGTKTAKVLDLLKRSDGATLRELIKATGWQPHSVRGFLSGTIGKKMGLSVTSVKDEDGERRYSVRA